MRLGIVALCGGLGCNQVFGISETKPVDAAPIIDAQYFDAPIDAPFACPPIGTPPQFSPSMHALPQRCENYSASSDHAVAYCHDLARVAQGPVDGPFTTISALVPVADISYAGPRLAPEGDRLVVTEQTGSTSAALRVFQRGASDSWALAGTVNVPFALDFDVAVGTPTRGPARRMFINNNDGIHRELALDASYQASVHATYTQAELGVMFTYGPLNMSADGLRIIYAGRSTTPGVDVVMYGERPSLADRFTVTRLDVASAAHEPFMTDNCDRIYFALYLPDAQLYWVQRQ